MSQYFQECAMGATYLRCHVKFKVVQLRMASRCSFEFPSVPGFERMNAV